MGTAEGVLIIVLLVLLLAGVVAALVIAVGKKSCGCCRTGPTGCCPTGATGPTGPTLTLTVVGAGGEPEPAPFVPPPAAPNAPGPADAADWADNAGPADAARRAPALGQPDPEEPPMMQTERTGGGAAALNPRALFAGGGVVPRPVGTRRARMHATRASRLAGAYVVLLAASVDAGPAAAHELNAMHTAATAAAPGGCNARLVAALTERHALHVAAALPSGQVGPLAAAPAGVARRGHVYARALAGFSVSGLSRAALERLRADPGVAAVHEDGLVGIPAFAAGAIAAGGVFGANGGAHSVDCTCPPPAPPPGSTQVVGWQVGRVGAARSSWTVGDGSSVVDADVYVLDTGLPNHPDITSVVSAVTFVPGATSPADANGHGTHVCGILAAADNTQGVVGCAPGTRLHIVQVLDASGSGAFSTVAAGVDYVLAQKVANPSQRVIANMSLGAAVGTTAYNALDLSVSSAIAGGCTFCIAVGNDHADARYSSPAHVTTAIGIGSMNASNAYSSFSNYGAPVLALGPGENINSTWLSSTYKILSGTSMATPAAAAVVAAWWSKNPSATPAQVKSAILAAAIAAGSLSPPISNPPLGTNIWVAWMGAL